MENGDDNMNIENNYFMDMGMIIQMGCFIKTSWDDLYSISWGYLVPKNSHCQRVSTQWFSTSPWLKNFKVVIQTCCCLSGAQQGMRE